ncbi:MAG: hypothetical protein WAX04_05825 [Oscillospiraceae bacterium]
MIKKILAYVLSLTMIILALSGCGKAEETKHTSSEDISSVNSENQKNSEKEISNKSISSNDSNDLNDDTLTQEEINTCKEQLPEFIKLLLFTSFTEKPVNVSDFSDLEIFNFCVCSLNDKFVDNRNYSEEYQDYEDISEYIFIPLKSIQRMAYECFGNKDFFYEYEIYNNAGYDKDKEEYRLKEKTGPQPIYSYENLKISTNEDGTIDAFLNLSVTPGYGPEPGWDNRVKLKVRFKVMKENGHVFTRYLGSEEAYK